MQAEFVRMLRARRRQIRAHWEALLRLKRVTSPLANPDMLVHLIDRTLDEIFATLSQPQSQRRNTRCSAYAELSADCRCGRNPLLAYFLAGEQTLLEALVLMRAEIQNLLPANRDTAVAELYFVLRSIARREAQAFCAVCQHPPDRRTPQQVQAPAAPCSFSR